MRDFIGNELKEGDTVVHSCAECSSCVMRVAKIVKFTEKRVQITYTVRNKSGPDWVHELYTVPWRLVKVMPE